MGKLEEKEEYPTESESLVANFHRVGSLIPSGQDLAKVPPETRVVDALRLMKRNHYSQLPVVAGDAVLGVFSYRSFSNKALAKQKSTGSDWLGDLAVEDFLEEFEYVHVVEDWNRVLRYLNQDDAFLVGHRDGLVGMVTTMDMLDYFREIANPFILLAEIELSLRNIILTCISKETMPRAIKKSLESAYPGEKVPTNLNEMTFDNYVQIISNGDNWPHFEQMFGSQERVRRQTNQKLQQLRDWRNIVFHFRRRLQQWELDTLSEHREWLHRRVRAFEGRQRRAKLTRQVKPSKKRGKTNVGQFMQEVDRSTLNFFNWMLNEAVFRGYTVSWGTVGFSVRKKLSHRTASFAYGYPPDKFEIYFSHLGLTDTEVMNWRRDLLSLGVLEEAGELTLRGNITDGTESQLRAIFSHMIEKMESLD